MLELVNTFSVWCKTRALPVNQGHAHGRRHVTAGWVTRSKGARHVDCNAARHEECGSAPRTRAIASPAEGGTHEIERAERSELVAVGMRSAWLPLTLLALSAASALRLPASAAGEGKTDKGEDADEEEEKTLSQQIADGKYGLIQKELYAVAPDRPGILSYADNPEVPRDTADTLGGLDSREIWLSENHVLVLRGGAFPDHVRNRSGTAAWPPIDAFQAPPRQVKIPPRPKVPPPFPIQLRDGGPTQLIGPNGTALPLPPGFPGNGSYFAPPFPPPGNFSPGDFPPPTTINGSLFPPPFPYPPPGNGSFFSPPFPLPPSGNVSTGNGPYFLPPFPGLPYPPLPPTANGTLPPFFPPLPPGAAILPPPDNMTDLYDEDDPSIYYPPPYDFFYPRDNSTEVPPGPLVPGIILPPPPNFFAPLVDTPTTKPPQESVTIPPTPSTVHRPPLTKPVITTTRTRTKPHPTSQTPVDISNNIGSTPVPPYVTPPKRPLRVEITHGGQSPLRAPVVYDDNLVIPPQEYGVRTVVFPTEAPISYNVAPVTDIIVRLKTPPQPIKQHNRKPNLPLQYYELPQNTYSSDTVLFQKPFYVLEYDSHQYQGHAPTSKSVTLVPTYYKNADNRISSTPRPYISVSPTPKASVYYYEEPTTTTPRAPQPYYQLPKQLTPEEQYFLQQIANGEYEYEQRQTRPPPSNYYWAPTTPRPNVPRNTIPYPGYYNGYSTPAPPPSYHYQNEATFTSSTTNYQTTPRSLPTAPTTPNSLLLHYTRQDEALIDDITKKYFTMFGQKLAADTGGPTTPLPPTKTSGLHPPRPTAIPLHGDTLVNYRRPLPPINPHSEFIEQSRPQEQVSGSLVSYQLPGNEGGHVYFLTPQLVHRQPDQQGYVYVTPPRGSQLRYRRNKDQVRT
ncbi:hypothetical protein PR048_000256 [Dryococelus australis]|uniref:Uncharacterized protein n=1 Tax=Dryococelus australis TaxID=614101 RepID=A0ABQ9IE41_9NEOP|nr:hypothetical protein PR048_000256 [Dryococelus australis]